MRVAFLPVAVGIMLTTSSVAAQETAVIDLNAKPAPFSQSDYDNLLACTLREQPEKTRRYSEYHLLRRNNQTVEENEADPDSGLMMEAIGDCFEFENGKPIPFSLNALVSDWGKAYEVYGRSGIQGTMVFKNAAELADCAVLYHRALVDEMLSLPRPMGAIQYLNDFMGSQCLTEGAVKLNLDEFYAAIDQQIKDDGAAE
ncbi:hypothetical protein [Alterisphingorhabdus coralli]|uniref:Uncharacterized protein n=1 Tax=Alterisphingorhabdus coralli TaxID=3071408 RepID=A0AA97I000_9SPHN|nr:hypothetical protein [Parasphingorhabdus sp. SCSIO 66989]WOE73923.1 hypothetical protein RB602_08605 [Parasphingorhabdus sp. SCSIO 66989]